MHATKADNPGFAPTFPSAPEPCGPRRRTMPAMWPPDFEPCHDLAPADWLRPRLLPWGSEIGTPVTSIVPVGYDAYTHIFHPADEHRRQVCKPPRHAGHPSATTPTGASAIRLTKTPATYVNHRGHAGSPTSSTGIAVPAHDPLSAHSSWVAPSPISLSGPRRSGPWHRHTATPAAFCSASVISW
jgi:hypothetical protein